MSKLATQEHFIEVDRSVRTRLALANESTYSYLVRITAMFKNPKEFGMHMRTVKEWLEPQLTDRTRPLYDEMTTLLTRIEKERPRNRSWHPPLTVRVPKSVTRDAAARYTAQRERIMVLFEQANISHQMEPFVAAQEKYKKAQSKRASEQSTLSERQQSNIVKLYTDRASTGSVYGYVKELANEFKVSPTAIHAVLRKHDVKPKTARPKNSIDKQPG
ncbi:hypothetical protein GJ698_16430 [Pseudoduganella sp. FT26W]|uniref:Uncharacterized protein n=1 Tax=Duganella aquatilis TaxID=2666082 RepID=A0A844D0L4_9BURK|nr:hypothetical protein [Duganella aquatilis]MRW85668.1 hypothetical protein [Duganella aquatilis]